MASVIKPGLQSILENGGSSMSIEEVNLQYERIRKAAGQQDMNGEDSMFLSKQRANSKEMIANKYRQHGQLPLIHAGQGQRVGSSGYIGSSNLRSNVQSMGMDSETDGGLGSPKNADPFQRRPNKFKNFGLAKQSKKARYSISENQNAFNSILVQSTNNQGQMSGQMDLNNPKMMLQEKKLTATLEEVNVLDLVNKGKMTNTHQQLKPISTKNLGKQSQSFGPMAFEVQKSVGLFKNSQENQSTINTHRSGARAIKSVLPSAIAQSKENIEQIVTLNIQQENKNKKKKRKISITTVGGTKSGGATTTTHAREHYSQSMVITESDILQTTSRNPGVVSLMNSREGMILNTDYQLDTGRQSLSQTLQKKLGGPQSMMLKLWQQLFEAKCEDLNIHRANEKQFHRFLKAIHKHTVKRKLVLNELGLGMKSAQILSQIIRIGGNLSEWTHIDLSFNKLGLNLEPVIKGLKMNNKIVALRLSNNEIGGSQQHNQLLKQLIMEHSSLTDIDLSNDESNQNKNKIGNAGFEAVMEGILDSKVSVLSQINVAQNNIIYSVQPETFNLLKALLTVRSEQIISLNLNDNDLGPDFFSTLGYEALQNLKELQLSNTRLNNKSLNDLSEYFNLHKFSFLNLDLSSNQFTSETFFKFLDSLRNNQVLRKLNLSKNNFSFGEDGPQGRFYTIFEQFIGQNKSIEEINLNDCRLGPEGAGIIGKGLRRNQKLQRLYLSQNKFEDKGLNLLLEGVLDNIQTTSQMQGVLTVAPIVELDISKNSIEMKDPTYRNTFCKILSDPQSKLTSLSIRDNLIRDEPAEAISLALKQNLSIMKFQIDMNPIKLVILKEIGHSIKRNIASHKEKQAPAIKKEINVLYEERQRVLEDLPISLQHEYQGKTLFETADHIDRKATLYEKTNELYKRQFMEDDRRLDEIREEALRQERELVKERERQRELRRDADFAEEQMDSRLLRQERHWEKQLNEYEEKLEIVKLAQSKTIDERSKVQKELDKKKDNHRLQVEAWNRELQIVIREQQVSAMIQESYVKEIDRVKKQQILMQAAEECKNDDSIHHLNPPATAGSVGHRFGNPQKRHSVMPTQRRGNSNLRIQDTNNSKLREAVKRVSTTIRQHLPLKSAGGGSSTAILPNNIKENSTLQNSPSQRILELQKMKKELKREFKKTEAEVQALANRQKEEFTNPLMRRKTIGANNDRISHAFRIPVQQNYP